MTKAEIGEYLEYLEIKKEARKAARKDTKESLSDNLIGCSAYMRYFSKHFSVSFQVKMIFFYRFLVLCCFSQADIETLNPEPKCCSYQVSEDKTKHAVLLH